MKSKRGVTTGRNAGDDDVEETLTSKCDLTLEAPATFWVFDLIINGRNIASGIPWIDFSLKENYLLRWVKLYRLIKIIILSYLASGQITQIHSSSVVESSIIRCRLFSRGAFVPCLDWRARGMSQCKSQPAVSLFYKSSNMGPKCPEATSTQLRDSLAQT